MSGNLIFPRCEVYWGKVNLTSYNGTGGFPKNEPLVYNTEVHLEATNNSPTASMQWNPTGPAFSVYEEFIKSSEKMKEQIVIRYFYANGKSIAFVFLWSGQSISFGNDMSVTVRMRSELDGLVNANIRSTAIPQQKSYLEATKNLEKLYALQGKKILAYNQVAKKDLQKAKIDNAYGNDLTFGGNVANLVKQNGNIPFAHNIGRPGIVVFAPFSFSKEEQVFDGAKIPIQKNPDPTKRYGYLLGPSIINTITRESEWKAPQQTKTNTPNTQTKAIKPGSTSSSATQNPQTKQQENVKESSKRTSAPLGTAVARPNPGISNKENKIGVDKQNALEEENTARLTMGTFLCPVLVGLKPHDILYIPSLTGDYIEDWIVQTVDYNQTDGGVDISVSATRIQGLGVPMNEKAAKPFMQKAKQLTTLEAWDAYAWTLSSSGQTDSPAPSAGEASIAGSPTFSLDSTGLQLNLSGQNALRR